MANDYWEKRLPAIDYMTIRNNDDKLFQFISLKYEYRKFAVENGVDPMTVIIKGSATGNNNRVRANYHQYNDNEVKGDLIDDDAEEDDNTNANGNGNNDSYSNGNNNGKKRYCSVNKISTSSPSVYDDRKQNEIESANKYYSSNGCSNSNNNSNNYYNNQFNSIQQLNTNDKPFNTTQPFNGIIYNQQEPRQYQSFNTPQFQYINHNQYGTNPIIKPNPQSMTFFNFNQSNPTNTFNGKDPFQQFMN